VRLQSAPTIVLRVGQNLLLISLTSLKIVEEASDEANYFLDVLLTIDDGKNHGQLEKLLSESGELTSIFSGSLVTIKNKVNQNRTS
jgi:hypothetical protein